MDTVQIVITGLIGLVGIPLVQILKKQLGWDGPKAALLSAGVAVVVALIALFGAGQLSIYDFTLDNFAVVFTSVFTVATLAYKLLLADR